MERGRVLVDSLNRRFRIKEPMPLSEAPPNLKITKSSKPWKIYLRMLGTVLPAFFLMYTSLFVIWGIIELDSILTLSAGFCSLPLVLLLFRIHRPKLVHVRLASPDPSGSEIHALTEGGSLRTPIKTTFQRFLVKDDSILDMPPSRQLWALFFFTISIGVSITFLFFENATESVGIAIFILLAIPLWLIGFSLPVLAWWGTSTSFIGVATRRREAEAWLIAGMASAFPAFIFNSLIAPEITPSELPIWISEMALLSLWAPLCEEIFKALAVALFIPTIKGPKKGFQVGFTVGLGFALIENFQYIGFSLLGGPLSITLTILVRGIGSIPGHAVWTAISGTAIGWMASDGEFRARMTWRAKNLAISAVDIAEGFGFDADGDGDLSGYDGERQTLDAAITDATSEKSEVDDSWLLADRNGQEIKQSKISSILEKENLENDFSFLKDNPSLISYLTPKKISRAIPLSIAGHSFWNGSSYLSAVAPGKWFGIGDAGSAYISFSWTIILITTVLIIARRMMRGVISLDSTY